jgi:putative restriction endonuclease
MLKSPIRKIGGYGKFIDYQNMTPSEAWQKYGTNNGVKNLEDLEARTKFYIDKQSADNSYNSIGCILLDNLEFFNNEDFKSSESYLGVNFPNQVVKIKYFDINAKERKIPKSKDLTITEEFISQKSKKKKKTKVNTNQRKGQQKFRDDILLAYNNKCAITGINDEYALEAAHIESYINEKSNHIKNGICLRADIHKLFDKNLIGINGDFKIFISPGLKDKEYTKLKNKKINLPKNKDFYPLKKLLNEKFKSFRR